MERLREVGEAHAHIGRQRRTRNPGCGDERAVTVGTELAVAEDCFVVRVRGSLDGAGASVVWRVLAGALTAGHAVSVDLSGVQQFDDDGLDALASAGAAAARQRLALVILNIAPELRRVLEAHHRGRGLVLEGVTAEGCRRAVLVVGPS